MNRRDTILVAVLVNVGLVVVLFVFGIKPASPVDLAIKSDAKTSELAALEAEKKIEDESATSIDQVDQILSKYIEQEEKKEVETVLTKQIVEPIAQPQIATPKQSDNKLKEVIVKQGDMLEKIARINKTSVEEIMRINSISSTRLQIGQILFVPVNGTSSNVSKVSTSSSKEPKYYVVKNGDNPWTIAIKNKIRVEELLKINSLDESKAKKLKPGDRLRIQ